jgi:hypothetical protein
VNLEIEFYSEKIFKGYENEVLRRILGPEMSVYGIL